MEVGQSSAGPHQNRLKILVESNMPSNELSSAITDDYERKNSIKDGQHSLERSEVRSIQEITAENQLPFTRQFSEENIIGVYSQNKLRTSAISVKKKLDPFGPTKFQTLFKYKIFAMAWMVGVLFDPLLLYIPTLNEDKKCISMDHNLKIMALVLRSVTDIFHFLHITDRIRTKFMVHRKLGLLRNSQWCANILIDILAALPLAQIINLVFLSKTWGWRSLSAATYLNIGIFLQFVPRVLRVYISCEELKTAQPTILRMWFIVGINFSACIIVSHLFGSLWYFFSIQREMACWNNACENHVLGCVDSDFDCTGNTLRNMASFNSICPINPPNATVFDYGMYLDAVKSGVLGKMSFPGKFVLCLSWGARNLSSFGQNLQTSINIWENCFAALISISGAILYFLFISRNLQRYIDMRTSRIEEIKEKMKMIKPEIDFLVDTHDLFKDKELLIMDHVERALKDDNFQFAVNLLRSLLRNERDHTRGNEIEIATKELMKLERRLRSKEKEMRNLIKERDAEVWMLKNDIPDQLKTTIIQYVRLRLPDNQDVNLETLHSMLPQEHRKALKLHFFNATLTTNPLPLDILNNEKLVQEILAHLKPVIYPENHYIIREGEPLDFTLFITKGVVYTFKLGTCFVRCLEKGNYYGEELLKWKLKPPASYSEFPMSRKNAKTHTKVEALALMATDLNHVCSKLGLLFDDAKMLKAVLFIQATMRRNMRRKRRQ